MTDLGDLLLLLAPVTLLAAWVGYGSERISYAGLQIGLAFYLVVLQGYGPTIDMYTARDRTIGILFGNIVVFVIFTTIWPVSVANVVRTNLARALEQLAALVDLGARTDGEVSQAARSAADAAFGQAIAQARAVLVNDPFETSEVRRAVGRRPIDATVVEQVGRLFIPVSAILDLRADLGRARPSAANARRDSRASPGAGSVVPAGSVMDAQRRGSRRGGRRPTGTAGPIRPGRSPHGARDMVRRAAPGHSQHSRRGWSATAAGDPRRRSGDAFHAAG